MSLPLTSGRPRISAPRSRALPAVMRPGGMGISPITLCTMTDLPQPDSPTTARVRPASTAKPTPRTAWTTPP